MKQNPKKTVKDDKPVKQDSKANVKVILAVTLVLIMAVMWIRVFTKGKSAPSKVSAATVETVTPEAVAEKPKANGIRYVELPIVAGRNDVLTRDIFSPKSWNGGGTNTVSNVEDNNAKGILSRDEIRQIAQSLKLEAIIMGQAGQPAEVFIENRIVPVGASFPVRRDGNKIIFTIDYADGNMVFIRCEDVSVKLRMSKLDEKNK